LSKLLYFLCLEAKTGIFISCGDDNKASRWPTYTSFDPGLKIFLSYIFLYTIEVPPISAPDISNQFRPFPTYPTGRSRVENKRKCFFMTFKIPTISYHILLFITAKQSMIIGSYCQCCFLLILSTFLEKVSVLRLKKILEKVASLTQISKKINF